MSRMSVEKALEIVESKSIAAYQRLLSKSVAAEVLAAEVRRLREQVSELVEERISFGTEQLADMEPWMQRRWILCGTSSLRLSDGRSL